MHKILLTLSLLFLYPAVSLAKQQVDGNETVVIRTSQAKKNIDTDFSFKVKKVWHERICLRWGYVSRPFPCGYRRPVPGPRPGPRPIPRPAPRPGMCWRTVRVCEFSELKRFERIVEETVSTRIKFAKSARKNFFGPEEYGIRVDKQNLCMSVEALNEAAKKREIVQGCRKAKVK